MLLINANNFLTVGIRAAILNILGVFYTGFFDFVADIRKLKAELAGPLEFGEVDSLTEGDGTSDLVRKGSIKVTKLFLK